MALDGIVISNLVYELNQALNQGRISKIAQPEPDELLLTIKNNKTQYKLLLSANASLPLLYLTEESKISPMTAPNFCMLLRKHINGGKICSITQPGLDRIVHFEIEHLNDLGDLCQKILTIEIMGKHSNIIFRNDDLIIDSIKHVPAHMSSIREVLPGRTYFVPETTEKFNPLTIDELTFQEHVMSKPAALAKALYTSLTGISPVAAEDICYQADIDSHIPANTLNGTEITHLYHTFMHTIQMIKDHEYTPNIIYKDREPLEFSSLPLHIYPSSQMVTFPSISSLLETYYSSKNTVTRIRQKSVDLRRIVQTALERNRKKYDLQQKQLTDTQKRDKFKVYGELIQAYGYHLTEGAKELEAENYYDNNKMIQIPLDPELTPQENAKKYFDRYNKLKRTYEAVSELIKETEEEILHLESIATSLDIALLEEDLMEIKEELTNYGYIRRKYNVKKQKITSKPFHYISSNGFHIYIGKNNFQNEDLTFKFASGNDWWFHAKALPGSHVIVKSNGEELPDQTFEEAARLAAYYSKGRDSEKVEIDYTEKRNVKKVTGAKPGFVIYHTNYSMLIEPDIHGIATA